MGCCWRSKNELISDVLLWTPSHGHPNVGLPTRTYLQQLYPDTGCNLDDLPQVTDDRWMAKESGKSVLAPWHIYVLYMYEYVCIYMILKYLYNRCFTFYLIFCMHMLSCICSSWFYIMRAFQHHLRSFFNPFYIYIYIYI